MRIAIAGLTVPVLALTAAITLGAQAKKPAAKKEPPPKTPTAEENYTKICLPCHGPEGKSPLPNPDMDLSDNEWKHGSSTKEIVKTITDGVPGTAMLPNKDKLSAEEILALAKLVRTFDPTLKPEKK